MATLDELRKQIPQLDGLSDNDAVDVLHQAYYSDLDRQLVADRLGVKSVAAEISTAPAGPMRKLADVGLAGAQGVVSGVKMFSDLAGADNPVSETLGEASSGLGSLMSRARQNELRRRSQIIDEANATGDTWEQVKAYMGGLIEAPASTVAQGLGSIAPTLPAMLIGGPAAGGAAIARGAALMGLGAAQGVGAVKGATFERVRDGLIATGVPAEEAAAKAAEAQSYLGPNGTDQMIAGVIGAMTGRIGAEGAIQAIVHGTVKAPGKLAPRVATGVLSEGATEALQGGQEQFAGNRALTNAGIETDPMMGVVGAGLAEGAVGGLIGGGLSLPAPSQIDVAKEATQRLAEAQTSTDIATAASDLAFSTPVVPLGQVAETRMGPPASLMPLESLRDQGLATLDVDSSAPLLDRILTVREQLDAPGVRQGIQERFGRDILLDTVNALQVADNRAIPDRTRELLIAKAENRIRAALMNPMGKDVETAPGVQGVEIDPVQAYVNVQRRTNTLQARAFVREFDAGRITPEDVTAIMARQPMTGQQVADERLRQAAAQAPSAPVEAAVPSNAQPAPGIQVPAGGAPRETSDWQEFAPETGTKGIPRAEMPQIQASVRGPMVNFLAARGITHESVDVPAGDLKPTQAEFSPSKVQQARDFSDTDRSILISSDGHILDGHHQWLAKMDSNEPVKAIRLNAPIEQLLPVVREFPSATQAEGASTTPAGSTTSESSPQAPSRSNDLGTAQTPEAGVGASQPMPAAPVIPAKPGAHPAPDAETAEPKAEPAPSTGESNGRNDDDGAGPTANAQPQARAEEGQQEAKTRPAAEARPELPADQVGQRAKIDLMKRRAVLKALKECLTS